MRRAAAALLCFLSLPLLASKTRGPCGWSPAFSVDRLPDGRVFLSFQKTAYELDGWGAPVAVVRGTDIAVTQDVSVNDVQSAPVCVTSTVDLGQLADGTYDVDWMLNTLGIGGQVPIHHRTRFVQAPSTCADNGLTLVVRPQDPDTSDIVQIDASELVRAADYDPPYIKRTTSHFAIQQTEHVNSIAIIEGHTSVLCHTRTFILGTLNVCDYNVVLTQPIDDPAWSHTVSATAFVHVRAAGRGKRRGARP